MVENYDFSGWATKNDIKCADGRTIRRDAFKGNDGQEVPLVWGHVHDDPTNVLGHALLVNKPEGVRCYGKFNNSEKAQHAKEAVENGDITHLSIWANKLEQKGGDVFHGDIKEVSLVLAGANIGAFIDVPIIEHAEDGDYFEATIYSGEEIELMHSEELEEEEPEEEVIEHADSEPEKKEEDMAGEKTVKDVFDTLTDEQKEVVYFMIGEALEGAGVEDEEGDEEEDTVEHSEEGETEEMAYNVFDEESRTKNVLTHSDEMAILEAAKKGGSFRDALDTFMEQNNMTLAHDDVEPAADPAWYPPAPVGGFYQTPRTEGGLTVESLFPEYQDIGQPWNNIITDDQGWVTQVIAKVKKSPISRVRTGFVDIRKVDGLRAEMRAKGYKKGHFKSYGGNFELVRRTTDPQTIYIKNALHRDDIVDITDFDYVQYLYNIDKMMMNEELATAYVFGDGRPSDAEDKIDPNHIRPIWLDDELYTMHHTLDMEDFGAKLQGSETDSYFGENYIRAEALIEMCLYTREKYKGTGTPDMLIHPHELNVMLLARDRNGRRIFSSKQELATSFNVGQILTCEQMIDKRREANSKLLKPLAIIVNFNDYQVGATKGGELTHFTQFDIDFNQQKSLLETRQSGALTKCWSAIAIEEEVEE